MLVLRHKQETSRVDLHNLVSLLDISDSSSDDLMDLENARNPGSCKWFIAKQEFTEWCFSSSSLAPVLWLSGNPGSGKSVIASRVINCLEEQNFTCSYFFFKYRVEGKSSMGDCLRSLAYQMALNDEEVRKYLLTLQASGFVLGKNDERTIWRKLFVDGIFRLGFARSHYWVVDALDECSRVQLFFSMMSKVDWSTSLRIFITSRNIQEIERGFSQFRQPITHVELLLSDTVDDIKSYILTRSGDLPVKDDRSLISLTENILTKSRGSFLWVRLVLHELEITWAEELVEEVLNEIPADMNLLYKKILDDLPKMSRNTKLAKSILTWTVCALRPLTLLEMQSALKIDINETVQNLEKSISSICGQLIFIDHRSRIQIIHQTAADFLLKEDLCSEFSVKKVNGHGRLAVKCLEFLSGSHFKAMKGRQQKLANTARQANEFVLADYACTFFSDHLCKSSSLQSEPWDALTHFLSTNILLWIEHLAKTGDLSYITRAAINIKAYLTRRAEHFPPIGQQVQTVDAWTVDLIRLSAKYRPYLLALPSSIYWLVPPMCPSESIIARKFASPHRGLVVKGLKSKTWDDCLTRFNYRDAIATAVASGGRLFGVGLSTGKIFIYQNMTGQAILNLDHLERVKALVFGFQDKVFASSSHQRVKIWDLSKGDLIWSVQTSHQVLAVAFANQNEFLMAATQDSFVTCWHIPDGDKSFRIQWYDNLDDEPNKVRKRPLPTHVLFSPDNHLLAVSYRGRPILLFDLESEIFFGNCVRESGLRSGGPETHYPIVSMAFNPHPEGCLLIVSYGDGELTVYNPWDLEVQHRAFGVSAHTLACSPDGRTLVTGSSSGTIQVFEFDGAAGGNLTLIYRINAFEEGIKSLAFSNDSLRFLDIRGSQCRVWEPTVLVRKQVDDCDQSDISSPVAMLPKYLTMVEGEVTAEFTTIVCHPDGGVVFCGKEDGSIAAHFIQDDLESCVLYKHNVKIISVVLGERKSILASVDESSRIIIRGIVKAQAGWSATDLLVDQRFTESIDGLLLSPANDRLLVSGKTVDELWTTQGQRVGSRIPVHQRNRKAILHPKEPASFILFETDVARIFSWAEFTELTAPDGVKLDQFNEPNISPDTSCSYHGQGIVVKLSKLSGDHSSTEVVCWQTTTMHRDSKFITSLPGFEILGPIVEDIIAVIENRLLFLDVELWVCSLDLTTFAMNRECKRHFFIPTDWYCSSMGMLFQFTSRKDFVLAKRHELLIIQGGLLYSDMITVARVKQSPFNQESKAHLGIL